MLIAILEDSAYRKRIATPYTKRWTVRVFAYDEEGKLVFLRIIGRDDFGKRNHLETIGGGVQNDETLAEALKREVREVIGYECEVIMNLGFIVDHYNLLNRETISNYFVVQLTNYVGEELSVKEKRLVAHTESYDELEALHLFKKSKPQTIESLVYRRDYHALKYYLDKKKTHT